MHCKPATRGRNSVVLAIPYAWQEHLQADEKIGHRVFKTEIPLSSQSDSSAKSFYQVSNYDVYHVKTLTSWGGSKSIPKIVSPLQAMTPCEKSDSATRHFFVLMGLLRNGLLSD